MYRSIPQKSGIKISLRPMSKENLTELGYLAAAGKPSRRASPVFAKAKNSCKILPLLHRLIGYCYIGTNNDTLQQFIQ